MIPVRALACLGNAADMAAWSGIPYHLFQAARATGFLSEALDLSDDHYGRHRLAWGMRRLLAGQDPTGYQHSVASLARMWARMPPHVREGELLSHFQSFPCPADAAGAGIRFSFYCDATLAQYWQQEGPRDARGVRREILAREAEGYRAAARVVGMSAWCARSVVRDYGVDPRKVFVARPGANLDEGAVARYLERRGPSWRRKGRGFSAAQPARLGFIGRDFRRKGLPQLVAAAEILDRQGCAVEVVAIGDCDAATRRHPLVRWQGRIDKHRELDRFLDTVDTFAVGCLLSRAEPLGIGTLECLRLGIPVCGTRVGGIPDCIAADTGFLVNAGASAEEIAVALRKNLFDPDTYVTLVAGAEAARATVTWASCVRELERIWNGTGRPAFAEGATS